MTHPLRNTLAATSLVLCGLSVAACAVSYAVPAGIRNDHWSSGDYNLVSIVAASGRLYLYHYHLAFTAPSPAGRLDHHVRTVGSVPRDDLRKWVVLGWLPYRHFSHSMIPGEFALMAPNRESETQWTLPLLPLVILFAILPIRWAILRRRERRRNAAKVCVRCGYDLRGSRGRCSECGELIPPPA